MDTMSWSAPSPRSACRWANQDNVRWLSPNTPPETGRSRPSGLGRSRSYQSSERTFYPQGLSLGTPCAPRLRGSLGDPLNPPPFQKYGPIRPIHPPSQVGVEARKSRSRLAAAGLKIAPQSSILTFSWLFTSRTPSVARAIEMARSAASWLGTLPSSETIP